MSYEHNKLLLVRKCSPLLHNGRFKNVWSLTFYIGVQFLVIGHHEADIYHIYLKFYNSKHSHWILYVYSDNLIWNKFFLSFQLANIVAGYTALVKSLNEELVTELINKDELTAEQDNMLETISELTDNLLWYLTSKELRD